MIYCIWQIDSNDTEFIYAVCNMIFKLRCFCHSYNVISITSTKAVESLLDNDAWVM